MSDRTPLQLQILDCPLSQVQAVIDLVDQMGLHLEHVSDGQAADDHLGLGLTYMNDQTRCGSAQEIAQHLQQVAPDASWQVWEDPKYEWLGTLFRFTPALGLFAANCDAAGTPVFTDERVLELHESPELLAELGMNHIDALRALEESNDGVVLPPGAGDTDEGA